MNRIIVSGNIVRDAELRYTPQGTAVAEFRIGIRDDLLKKRENRSVFISIVLFGQRAELIHKYLLKGKPILVEGRLDIKTKKLEDGRTFTNIQVYADKLEFLGKKEGTAGSPEPEAAPQETHNETPPEDFEIPQEENE